MNWKHILSITLLAPVLALGFGPSVQGGEVRLPGTGGFTPKVKSFKELRDSRVTLQKYDFSCGSAAIATLLTFTYNDPVSEEDVFVSMFEKGNKDTIRKVGFSLLDMQAYLNRRGYKASGYQLNVEQLRQLAIPAIVMISPNGYNHFVVLRGWDGTSVMIADSNRGLKRMAISDFEKYWNGVAFLLEDQVQLAQARYNDREDLKIIPAAPIGEARDRAGLSSLINRFRSPSEF
jgi:predicted double-glycine peptidase